jgi:mannose-6-phosphate isomerase
MQPLVFEPYLRPQVWGGRRLQEVLGKRLSAEGRFGESWEVSAHPQHVSRVAEGPLAGRLLTDLWREHPAEFFGTHAVPPARFPLLVKYLDCEESLSVQVHPTDELARELLGEKCGKTEAWVVIAAEPEGRIFAGLKPGVTRRDFERHLAAGTVAECLHSFTPKAGDCVHLPAGTVHAVGGGVVLAEVQQSSDATFRLFDWNRIGPDGKPRPLHREHGLRAIDWSAGPVNPVIVERTTGFPNERLVRCPYFTLDRHTLDGGWRQPFEAERLTIWMLLEGEAELTSDDGYQRTLTRGETILVPASGGRFVWSTTGAESATLLLIETSFDTMESAE